VFPDLLTRENCERLFATARSDLEELHVDDQLDAMLEEFRNMVLQTPANQRRTVMKEVLQKICPDPKLRTLIEPKVLQMIDAIEREEA